MIRRGFLPWGSVILAAVVAAGAVIAIDNNGGVPRRSSVVRSGSAGVAVTAPSASADPLSADMSAEQAKLRLSDRDYTAWAQLGLDYVQEAKITVNPAYYPKAEGVLQQSLAINGTVNYLGMAGEAALKAAEHNFVAARAWAQRGLTIDPYNVTLYGSLDDADTQLGLYSQAFGAAQKMNDLHPGVAAYTRAEYVFELQGDIIDAKAMLTKALAEAASPADKAFARYYLGELAFNSGDPTTALSEDNLGLAADPTDPTCLEGKAKAEAALGETNAAVTDYLAVVAQVPQPQYVVEAGELLDSIGRTKEAQQQYLIFDTENRLFVANGVTLDTDPTLFYADHGEPAKAMQYGQIGIKIRPFLDMDDAYAWALHVNGRDTEALSWETKAMQLGTRNALFYFHAGMIEKALGNRAQAKADLQKALAINRYFSPYQEPVARQALNELGADA